MPGPSGGPLGIDVSNHQGWINWQAVAESGGASFAFMKATEGTYYNDTWFARNWLQAAEWDIPRGAYHFARPSRGLPEQEAQFFLNTVLNTGPLREGDMLVLDMEDEQYHGGGPYGSAGAWSLGFLQYLEAAVGFRPIFYWATWYRLLDIQAVPELGQYPLWLASYQALMPMVPAPWDILSFWQYTSSGHMPGVQGDCDLNEFNGRWENIKLLGKPGEGQPQPPDPQYIVGPGILSAMTENGDTPVSNEHYVTPDWSEAFGASGARYVYISSRNQVVRFDPNG